MLWRSAARHLVGVFAALAVLAAVLVQPAVSCAGRQQVALVDIIGPNGKKINYMDTVTAISLEPQEQVGVFGDEVHFVLKASWDGTWIMNDAMRLSGKRFGYVVRVSHRFGEDYYAPQFVLGGIQGEEITPGWSEVAFPDPPNDAEKTGTVTIHIQDVPGEVVAQIIPYVVYKDTGELVMLWKSSYFKEAVGRTVPAAPPGERVQVPAAGSAGAAGFSRDCQE